MIVTGAVEGCPASRRWSLDYFEQRFGNWPAFASDDRRGDGQRVRGLPRVGYLRCNEELFLERAI